LTDASEVKVGSSVDGSGRARLALRNAAANYVNFGVVAAAGFALNPVLLRNLGASNFGLWRASQRMLDFASVADGRTAQALKWIVAHGAARRDASTQQRQHVGAALVLWALWLPVLLAVAVTVGLLLPVLLRDSAYSPGLTRLVGLSLGLNVVLYGVLSIPDSVLVGVNRGYLSTNITTGVTAATSAVMAALAIAGRGPLALALTLPLSAVVNAFLTWRVARRRVAWWGAEWPSRGQVRDMAAFSGWTLAWQATNKLLLSADLVLVGVFIGLEAAASYTFTTYLAQFVAGACQLTTSALMPPLGAALGSGEYATSSKVATITRSLTLAMATTMACGIVLLNRLVVGAWVGGTHYLGLLVTTIVALDLVQCSLLRTDAQILDSGLRIARSVVVTTTFTIAGVVLAIPVYQLTQSLPWMLVALVAPRLVPTLALPRMVRVLVHGGAVPRRDHILSGATFVTVVLLAAAQTTLELPSWLIAVGDAIVGSGLLVLLWALTPEPIRERVVRRLLLSVGRT
jgi:O-antigen/teichoic acid export membrane protein